MPKRSSRDLLLAGDIGGTHARFRLYDRRERRTAHEKVLPSRDAPSLAAMVGAYLASQKAKVAAAVLGIAGPVVGGVVRATNLPWTADERHLARDLDIPKVKLVNDLAALAVGCTRVGSSARVTVAKGRGVQGSNMAVIAAGTGLGEALLVWNGTQHLPSATEGGHADFAPVSDLQVELWAHLRRQTGGRHVSVEHVLSGPGLGRIYDFLLARGGRESVAVERQLRSGDRNAVITELGLAKKSRVAAAAVDLFVTIYGAEAGNLVLKSLSLGGLFVCGGIATRVIPPKKTLFLAAMRDKGRMAKLLTAVPVTLVHDRFVGLVGAGHLAARLAAE